MMLGVYGTLLVAAATENAAEGTYAKTLTEVHAASDSSSADVIPIVIQRRQLLESAGLGEINVCGELDLRVGK